MTLKNEENRDQKEQLHIRGKIIAATIAPLVLRHDQPPMVSSL
jgi:hypothetical protein